MHASEPTPARVNPAAAASPLPLDAVVRDTVDAAVAKLRSVPGALLPILHAVHDALGHLPAAAVARIADGLNLSRAEVHGVVSFYHDFRATPPGRHVLKLCRAEACQALGARALEVHARHALGIGFGETSADGAISLEPVYCLGNCACGPSLMLDGTLHGRVTPAVFDALAAQARKP
jgi:formate dehydrogenase subunit gamma